MDAAGPPLSEQPELTPRFPADRFHAARTTPGIDGLTSPEALARSSDTKVALVHQQLHRAPFLATKPATETLPAELVATQLGPA